MRPAQHARRHVAGSQQYSVTSGAAVLLASAPGSTVPNATLPGPLGQAYIANGSGGTIYLGGSNVSTSNGIALAASTTLPSPLFLFSGDAIYAIASSTTSTVSVLQTGA